MNNNLSLLFAMISLVLVTTSVSAEEKTTEQPPKATMAHNNLSNLEHSINKLQQEHIATAFCYYEDKKYSEGAKLNGLICRRQGQGDLHQKNQSSFYVTFPLFWDTE